MLDLLSRLYRTKLLLSAVLLVVAGIGLLALDRVALGTSGGPWTYLPLGEFGGILIGAGLLSIWLDHFMGREQAAIDDVRLTHILQDQAPALRDAVLEAFAADTEDLKRVATPELLDGIITNSLALRLGDRDFASEIYTDLRDQAILATERWEDASLSIDMAPADPPTKRTRHDYFAVTVRWEYQVVPAHRQRRFVCLSDRQEYAELANERDGTSAWYLKPTSGLDASSQQSFELTDFTVNGKARPIRRTTRKESQIYTVHLGSEADGSEPITIAYSYRTLTRRRDPLLFFDVEQPTRNLKVDLDYGGTDIEEMAVLDLLPTLRPVTIERTPADRPHSTVRLEISGWTFPRSGIAFAWTRAQDGLQPVDSKRH